VVARYELAAGGARSEWGESNEMLALRQEVDRIATLIAGYVAELEQIGVTIKGFDDGLVDFYAHYEGRLVCLCWKEGEESVSHWHEVEAGFAGRQPITAEFIAGQEPAHTQGG
jgi:hypothetical protein